MVENKRIELLINVTPLETRVASIEEGTLKEVHIERTSKLGIVGNIYLGKVVRVLPGMQAAFVDIGLEKAAFLHATDMVPNTECVSVIERENFNSQDISQLVQQGQFLVVQVIKEPLGTKGARLTTDLTIPSRYLVFIPQSQYVGISQRIESEMERERLKGIVNQFETCEGGFIVRTAAEGATIDELQQDANFLRRLWGNIKQRREAKKTSMLLYAELALAQRILRDSVGETICSIKVDSKLTYELLSDFCVEFMPELVNFLELYLGEQPIFDRYGVELAIQQALERKVKLKSGGYLVIDQTEAMTTIDINTGSFVGHRNLDETIFNINIEATKVIADQLRLRNLGGIIIVDFIDMKIEEHRTRTLMAFQKALSDDRVKTTLSDFSALGLVEITRKRTRESLEQMLCSECPECRGRGKVKTVETVCYEILREVVRVNLAYESDGLMIYAVPEVVNAFETEEAHALAEVEVFINKRIQLKVEHLYTREQFDVVMV